MGRTSDAFRKLLDGEITAAEYVDRVKAEVDAELAPMFERARRARLETQADMLFVGFCCGASILLILFAIVEALR